MENNTNPSNVPQRRFDPQTGQPIAPPPKKKTSAGLIIGIIALVVILLVGACCVVYFLVGDRLFSSGKTTHKANGQAFESAGIVIQDGTGAEPEDTEPEGPETGFYYISNKNGLPLRAGPGQSYEAMEVLPYCAKISVQAWEGDWAFTGVGWLEGRYLSEELPVGEEYEYYYVATENYPLNIRSGPGESYEIIGSVERGTQVAVELWNGEWAYIGDGWVSGEYLSKTEPEDEPVQSGQLYYTTAASGLVVRSGPGKGYSSLKILPYGTEVYVQNWNGDWAYIGDGWVSGEYLATDLYDSMDEFYYVSANSGLLLRTGPGTGYDYIRNIPYGTMVAIYDWSNGWGFTGEGWLSGDYLMTEYDWYYGCTHSWVSATCQYAKYCELCGETSGSALGHSYSGGYCTRCSAAEPGYSGSSDVEVVDLIDQTGMTIGFGSATINSVSYQVSGSTLYVTISFSRGATYNASRPIEFDVTVYGGYGTKLTTVSAATEPLAGGESTTITVAITDVITSEYSLYKVYVGGQY